MGLQEDRLLVATSAIFMFPLNVIGLSYVYYRVISHFRRQGTLPPTLRLPFYIAVIDTFICGFFGAELTHTLITGELWEDRVCSIFGGVTTYFIIANFVLISSSSMTTYIRVRFHKMIDTGKYEFKLLLPVVVVPATFCGVYAFFDAFGGDGYFCFIRQDKKILAAIVAALVILSVVQIAFCYISVVIILYRTIRKYEETPYSVPSTAESVLSQRERQVVWKVSMYILACLIQYIPGCPYPISYLFVDVENGASKPVIIVAIAVITIQTGGVINAITLLVNEGLKAREGSTKMSSSSRKPEDPHSFREQHYSYNFSEPGTVVNSQRSFNDQNSYNWLNPGRSTPGTITSDMQTGSWDSSTMPQLRHPSSGASVSIPEDINMHQFRS